MRPKQRNKMSVAQQRGYHPAHAFQSVCPPTAALLGGLGGCALVRAKRWVVTGKQR